MSKHKKNLQNETRKCRTAFVDDITSNEFDTSITEQSGK